MLMSMFAKVVAGTLMGIVAAALCHVVVGGAVGGDEGSGKAGSWTAVAGFLVVFVLAVTASRGRDAWGRGLLIAGLLSLLMAIVVSGIFDTDEVGRQAADAGRVGAAVMTVMAGTLLAPVFAILGFFFGPVFLVGSYLALRKV
jgi:hypothetical protein